MKSWREIALTRCFSRPQQPPYLLHLQSCLAKIRPESSSPRLLFEEALLGESTSHLSLDGGVLVDEDVVDPSLAVPEVAAVDLRRQMGVLPPLHVILIVVILWKEDMR